jgi:hypothetical protein
MNLWLIYLWGAVPTLIIFATFCAIDAGRESAKGSPWTEGTVVAALFCTLVVAALWPVSLAIMPFVGVSKLAANAYRRGAAKLERQRDELIEKALSWEQLAAAPDTVESTVIYAREQSAILRARAEAIEIPPVRKK